MSESLSFPRPVFSPEQVDLSFDFTSLIGEAVRKAVTQERVALGRLTEIAAVDQSKPGIMIRVEFDNRLHDTYVFATTVEFDESVPRGEVRYAPLPANWLR